MHPTALAGFRRMLDPIVPLTLAPGHLMVLDVGGADVNGTVHAELREAFDADVSPTTSCRATCRPTSTTTGSAG